MISPSSIIALIITAQVGLLLADTKGCSLTHPIVLQSFEFALRMLPFTDCEPNRHVQLLATVQGLELHSQFFKEARCGVPFDWAIPASTSPGKYTVTAKALFYNYTDGQILHDLNHWKNEEEWVRLVSEWGVRYSNATLCQAELLVSSERDSSIDLISNTASVQQLDNNFGYWNLTSTTFAVGSGSVANLAALPAGEYVLFGDSVLRSLFPQICLLAGAVEVAVPNATETTHNCQRCCSTESKICLQRQMWWHDGGGDSSPPRVACPPPANVRALYLSFGSHAHGIGSSNEQLARSERLMLNIKAAFNASTLVVAAVTAINEDLIPAAYQKQTFLLSNGRIHHRNLLAQFACQRTPLCNFLDLFKPTLALRNAPGAFRFGDPIHFGIGHTSIAQLVVHGLASSAANAPAQNN